MLSLQNLAKQYGARTLFRDVSINFHAGQRVGIVGANGSGKSTLLRIVAGDEEPSAGSCTLVRRARLGVLEQDHFQYDDVPILDVAMMGHEELWGAMEEKRRLLERGEADFDVDRFGELESFIQENGGYVLEARAAEILAGLGIDTALHAQPLSVLSGGYKLRALLGKLLAGEPDVLLLDEPTNHLDILSIRWLERFLTDFKGLVLIVSHDHRFLNNVCTHVVDVDYELATLYRGNYDAFSVAKVEERERKEAEIAKREREIEDHKRFVERFRAKPTKARQAKSRAKQIDKIEIEELPQSSRRYPAFEFPCKRASGRTVLEIDGVSKAFGEKTVLTDVTLRIARGERVAVIGPNGIGKSTLLKIVMGRLEADAGAVAWGYETHPGYFAQDHRELLEQERETIQSWLWDRCPTESIGYVRARLARVLFKKEEAEKRVEHLSGGEGARLVFARLGVEEPNVLVLDEPTNHLDLEGIEALAASLLAYEGTLLFVSHDRWLVNRLATRILEVRRDGIVDFAGSYAEYLAHCGDDHLDVEAIVARAKEGRREAKRSRGGDGRRKPGQVALGSG
ncbi:MAG: ABC-F family ATP-binding cassette domain-containing protein [Deltaproteobacteria bacterium]|nr:ABC-F family ATP-binding cassette domain-containing protein [Deltaproteobacteria bacterium]